MNNYLLELGVEEFPADYVAGTMGQLKEGFTHLLEGENIAFESVQVYSTPRRFAVMVRGMARSQSESTEMVKGPAKRIAYDAEGNPSKALLGFARGQGVDAASCFIQDYNGEDYVFVEKKLQQESVDEVLITNIPNIIRTLTFPKSMKWGGKSLRFARPLRWVISLYNDAVLPFELEGIPVSNVTRGHRVLGSDHIVINGIDDYENALRDNFVIVSNEERRNLITRSITRLAKEKGGNVLSDPILLEEVVNIIEYPTPLIGNIHPRYMELPKEVITTPMKDHQRYFPVQNDKGTLLPYFITIRNGDQKGLDTVKAGNEKVLTPRLEDAKFFFEQDLQKPLLEYIDHLKTVTFHEKLGSVYNKAYRLIRLSHQLGERLEVGDETLANVERAALLCKADLTTKMVIEFTELQGKMGRIYALESGENAIVANAIAEHYLPRFATDDLPKSTSGMVLSIADKVDTIAGLFAVGVTVTGSQDPYALRRGALGVINTIIEHKLRFDLAGTVKDALYNYVEKEGIVFDYEEVSQNIRQFFVTRLRNKMIDDGYSYDVIDSVIDVRSLCVFDVYRRVDIVTQWLSIEDNKEALTAFSRLESMAKKGDKGEIDYNILMDGPEKALVDQMENLDSVQSSLDRWMYTETLTKLQAFVPYINDYMDQVMILVEDEGIKRNRLHILNGIYEKIAQFFIPERIVKNNG